MAISFKVEILNGHKKKKEIKSDETSLTIPAISYIGEIISLEIARESRLVSFPWHEERIWPGKSCGFSFPEIDSVPISKILLFCLDS